MRFEAVAELGERLERESSRLGLVALTAEALREAGSAVEHVARFVLGQATPPWEPPLDVSAATVSEAVRSVVGDQDLRADAAATGDWGEAVRRAFQAAPRKQARLDDAPLGVGDVARSLLELARFGGAGSRRRKGLAVQGLLASCSPLEAKLLVKVLAEGTRHGVSSGLMEDAVAKAFDVPLESVRRAHMLVGDLGAVAQTARTAGREGLDAVTVEPGRPFLPMLAGRAENAAAAVAAHGTTSLETKLDGARVQVHRDEERVWLFSRRLTDLTRSFPELVPAVHGFHTDALVLEGEVVAVDADGRPRPFQHLGRRIRRVADVARLMEEVPVRLVLFDALRIGDDVLLDEPYRRRRRLLEELVEEADVEAGTVAVVARLETGDGQAAERFFRAAKAQGHEGFVAKRPDSPYEPGRRGHHWLKVKEPLATLDLVVTAAEWGTGKRHRWLSDWHLAVRSGAERGGFVEVGKTYQGLTDAELGEMTQRLRDLELREEGPVVHVRPEIVVEVAFDGVLASPTYPGGVALRFARIVRVRDDVGPEAAATLDEVRALRTTEPAGADVSTTRR